MIAGAAKIDITPTRSVWMEGMIRTHKSEGVHDPLHARALYLSDDFQPDNGFVIVSIDVCALNECDSLWVRQASAAKTGIPVGHIVIAATHTHSGPATVGIFNPVEDAYVGELKERLVSVITQAKANAVPASVGCKSGEESTISHYRRLLSDCGTVVMNWEPHDEERIVKILGEPDTQLGVLVVAERDRPEQVMGVMFSHAGHPNVMSGENYLISADYPGVAAALVEQEMGGVALFVNGAQGSVDIDGLKDREWHGVTRIGTVLAEAVISTAKDIPLSDTAHIRGTSVCYSVPARKITEAELLWADDVQQRTNGEVGAVEDGVGDDYLASLYNQLKETEDQDVQVEQICMAINETAFVSFPGELFTEIGQRIKASSTFDHTYPIGLANGYIGYVPTREAISQGGYEPSTRRVEADTEDIVIKCSLALLSEVAKL